METRPRAYRGTEPYAFVAYSHRDEGPVLEEIGRMAAGGFHVYYDDGIHPGQRWREEIASAIDGASVLVFFVTPHAVVSDDCLRELNYALDQGKPVLAVHLQETELTGGVKTVCASCRRPKNQRRRRRSRCSPIRHARSGNP